MFSSVFASYLIALIGLALLFIYTIFVLKVDYGNNLPLIILLGITGSLAGLSMGLVVGTVFKTNENTKNRNPNCSNNVWLFFIRNDGYYNEVYCR